MGRTRKIWKYSADLEHTTAHIVRVFNAAGFNAQVVVFARDEKFALHFARIGYPHVERDKIFFEYLAPAYRVKISPEYILS